MKHDLPPTGAVRFLSNLYFSYIPNRKDNIKQILTKVFFLLSLLTLIVSAVYLSNYFLSAYRQDRILENSRRVWHAETTVSQSPEPTLIEKMLAENSDFKGWIRIAGTQVDNPFYQAADNAFYLTHNQRKETSAYGALFLSAENSLTEEQTDQNLVIYGHNMKNGSMFGSLKKLRSLQLYKASPVIEFSTLFSSSQYRIYAVFVLNAAKADDNGYIYNIARKSFRGEEDFQAWVNEAEKRSLIQTGVDVQPDDRIVTLITCADDFENARLVVMARETRQGEAPIDPEIATVNPSPQYPKRWYDDRGLTDPFLN